jgi:AcrR family transcriptional regulator
VARPRTVRDDAVLAATLALIGRVGPARLTLAHVAGEVGLAPATLVQRFGSKRGLLLAAARRGSDWAGAFATARAGAGDPLEALADALVGLSAGVATPAAMANNLAFLQLDLADADFHAEAAAGFEALREQCAALLAEAGAADPARAAEAVLTTYNGALITWAVLREGTLEAWLRRQLHTVLAPYATRRPVSAVE